MRWCVSMEEELSVEQAKPNALGTLATELPGTASQ